jgi:hypothetical protein
MRLLRTTVAVSSVLVLAGFLSLAPQPTKPKAPLFAR